MMRSFKELTEAKETVVFGFGRFNPPTTGHEKLIEKVASVAGSNPFFIYPSHTTGPKDPLPHAKKIAWMRKMFPKYKRNIIADRNAKTAIMIAEKLYKDGYKNLIMVAGSDRVKEFDTLLQRYNDAPDKKGNQLFKFDSVKVVSAGERDPDSEGVSGMSASKMRDAAEGGDFDSFKTGIPSTLNDADKKKLYFEVRKAMGIREERAMGEDYDSLRDAYLTGKIWNVGESVEANGVSGEVVRKGTNYLSFVSEDGKVHKAWLHEIELDEGPKTHFVYQRDVSKSKRIIHRGTEQSSKDWIKKNAKHYEHKGKDFDIYKGKSNNVLPADRLDWQYVAEEVELDERNYALEYQNYGGRPEQIARRSSRNKARRAMGDKAVKGMDVGHKDNNPLNNSPENLRNEDPSDNRREPRLREVKAPDIKKGDTIILNKAKRPYTVAGIIDPKKTLPAETDKMVVQKITKSKDGRKAHLTYHDTKKRGGFAIYVDKMPDFMSVKIVEETELDEDVSVYNKTARKNKSGKSTFAFGRRKKLNGQPKEKGGYWVFKLSKNYDGKVRGGIRNSWGYVAKDVSYSDAVKLMNKKLGRKEFKEEVELDEMSWYKAALAKISQLNHPKDYKTMLKRYMSGMKDPEHRKHPSAWAANVAREYNGVNGRSLIKYINKLVDDGKLPKELKAELQVESFSDFVKKINEVKQDKDVNDKDGTQPAKYYAGDMAKSTKDKRDAHFKKKKSGPAPGDSAKTKPSTHTKKFKQMFGEVLPAGADQGDYIDDFQKSDAPQFKGKSKEKRKEMAIAAYLSKNEEVELDEKIEGLVNKAEKSGMPYSILKKVYDRGMAAFKTGHRPGATAQQWAFARVNSFTTKSAGTWGKADADLAKQVEMVESVELNEWGEVTEVDAKSGKELNNPTKGDIKKYKVYVKNAKGNVIKVEFGDPNMSIERDNPEARAAFRARHNCDQKKDKTTAGYWSCKFWSTKSVTDLMKG
jgi:hypothetical protein